MVSDVSAQELCTLIRVFKFVFVKEHVVKFVVQLTIKLVLVEKCFVSKFGRICERIVYQPMNWIIKHMFT